MKSKKCLIVDDEELITAEYLDTRIDDLQTNIPGMVTMVYDAGTIPSDFFQQLTPPANKERIVISSANVNQTAHFLVDGEISFSRFFWLRVLNGANVRDAFIHARLAMIDFAFRRYSDIKESSFSCVSDSP